MTRWNEHLETIVLLGASSALVGGTGRALLPQEEAPALHRVVRGLAARA